jgi:carboxymethylenebutenolidase
VAWYGRLTGDRDALRPKFPIDVAGALKAPVLGLYGAEDQGIPQTSVEEMRKALAGGNASARRSEIKVYPQAGHAFFADYRPSYRAEAAADGWQRTLAWFKRNGA